MNLIKPARWKQLLGVTFANHLRRVGTAGGVVLRQWRNIASRKKNIWVEWVHKKYIKDSSFWEIGIPSNCSSEASFQTGMLRWFNSDRLLATGRTLFWFDPWLLCGRLVSAFGHRAIYELGLCSAIKASRFISNGNRCLPVPTNWSTFPAS